MISEEEGKRGRNSKKSWKRGSSAVKRPGGPMTLPARPRTLSSIRKVLAAKEVEEERSEEVAENVWANLPK